MRCGMGQQEERATEEMPACKLVAEAIRHGVAASGLLARLLGPANLGDLGLRGVDEVAGGNP